MAGIGFELKKLYDKQTVFSGLQAYQCAGIVCTGPLLFSVFMLANVVLLTKAGMTTSQEKDLLVCLLTYTMIASLLAMSPFTLVINRYIADMIYEKRMKYIMPSFFGCVGIIMILGGILYGVFLSFSGVDWELKILCLILLLELIVTWMEIHYLTAIKNYKGIVLGFFFSSIFSNCLSIFFLVKEFPRVPSLIFSISVGYGIMLVWYLVLLLRAYPKGKGSSFTFLIWLDRYRDLSLLGVCQTLGIFGHQVLMWTGSLAQSVAPLFCWAPSYDVPVFLAFLTTLVTTVSFTMTVEVRFYRKYRIYFGKLNGKSTRKDIELAEEDMLLTLSQELYHTAFKQSCFTLICIVASEIVLSRLNMGFTKDMISIFQVLCLGYALFAVGNMFMLIQLYFADLRRALISTILFAGSSIIGTLLSMFGSSDWYGYGFLFGSAIYYFFAWFLLKRYIHNIKYHVLSAQPLGGEIVTGPFYNLYKKLKYIKENN